MHRHWLRPDWDQASRWPTCPRTTLDVVRVMLLGRSAFARRDVELPEAMQRWVNDASRNVST